MPDKTPGWSLRSLRIFVISHYTGKQKFFAQQQRPPWE